MDEYQDVNLAQVRLLQLLAGGGANVCVIGDPDQAIYGFRGADQRYFARSTRSSQRARPAAAHKLPVTPSPHRRRGPGDRPQPGSPGAERLLATFAAEVKVDVYAAPTDKAEAEYVVHQIEQMVGGTSYFSLDSGRVASDQQAHRDFGEFAVIYRLNAQSRLLVEALERSGIPYQVGGQTLAELPPTREVVAGLWLLHNPGMPVHLHTLLAAHGIELAPALFAALHESVAQGRGLSHSLEDLASHSKLKARQREQLAHLAAFWAGLDVWRATAPVLDLADALAAYLASLRTSRSHQPNRIG